MACFFETALPGSTLLPFPPPQMVAGDFNINEAETSVRYLSTQRACARVYVDDKKPEGGECAPGENLRRVNRDASLIIFLY